jgi:hypothetical protein
LGQLPGGWGVVSMIFGWDPRMTKTKGTNDKGMSKSQIPNGFPG